MNEKDNNIISNLNANNLTAADYLINKLIECALACERCYDACLHEADVSLMSLCIELDRDCSEICFQAAKLLRRKSEMADKFLLICEEACRNCAKECNKHPYEHCKICAAMCGRCAEMCHENHGNFALA